jgi:hypothetical protein
MTIQLQSVITCPECGFAKEETMPTDYCQFFYTCSQLQRAPASEARRLLRILLVWQRQVSFQAS